MNFLFPSVFPFPFLFLSLAIDEMHKGAALVWSFVVLKLLYSI